MSFQRQHVVIVSDKAGVVTLSFTARENLQDGYGAFDVLRTSRDPGEGTAVCSCYKVSDNKN